MVTYHNTSNKKTHKPTDYFFGVFQKLKYFNRNEKKKKKSIMVSVLF